MLKLEYMEKKFSIAILTIILFCAGVYSFLFVQSAAFAPQNYKKGLQFIEKKQYRSAYKTFRKINFVSDLYPSAIYKQAYCAKQVGDSKTALRKYLKFAAVADDKNLAPIGLWEAGNIYLETKREKQALSTFKKLIKKYPKSDYAYAAKYKKGAIIYDKRPQDAVKYFLEYIKYAPSGRFSKNAVVSIQNSYKTPLTDEEKIVVANSLTQNGEYQKSLDVLAGVGAQKSWLLRAQNYEKLNQTVLAQQAYLGGLANLKAGEDIKNGQIQDAIISFENLYPDKKLSLQSLVHAANSPQNPAYYGALFNYAEMLPKASACPMYFKIYTRAPKSHWGGAALAESVVCAYMARNFAQAADFGHKHISQYPKTQSSAKAIFWTAKALEKQGKGAQAISMYKKILHDSPDSYYAFRVENKIKNSRQPFKTNKNLTLSENLPDAAFPHGFESKTMRSLNKLAKLGDIQAISDFKLHDNFVQSYIARKNGRHVYSMLLARDKIDKTADKNSITLPQWQLAYPVYYASVINKNARQYAMSPFLLIAIIKEESHFDTSAKSKAGARGLMQVMPQTADFVKGQTDWHDFEDINYNISLGTKYFAQVKKELYGDEMLAVLAYNAGPGAVKKWLEQKNTSDVDEFIENIPYPETRNYVQKIFATYWNYLRIYAK